MPLPRDCTTVDRVSNSRASIPQHSGEGSLRFKEDSAYHASLPGMMHRPLRRNQPLASSRIKSDESEKGRVRET